MLFSFLGYFGKYLMISLREDIYHAYFQLYNGIILAREPNLKEFLMLTYPIFQFYSNALKSTFFIIKVELM